MKVLVYNDSEGAKIRSKVQWLEHGERPTRFFFKLERERFEKNVLSSILDRNGTEVFSRKEIERAHMQFYSHLFAEELIDPECKQECFKYFS